METRILACMAIIAVLLVASAVLQAMLLVKEAGQVNLEEMEHERNENQ